MGFWDLLSSHMPYNKELPPTGLSSWTKIRLVWIDPTKIALVNPGETTTVRLDPLSSDDAETLVIRIPLSDSAYYLIENRQPIESDVNLPSFGVLILYTDDSVNEGRHGNAPVKIMGANPDYHPRPSRHVVRGEKLRHFAGFTIVLYLLAVSLDLV